MVASSQLLSTREGSATSRTSESESAQLSGTADTVEHAGARACTDQVQDSSPCSNQLLFALGATWCARQRIVGAFWFQTKAPKHVRGALCVGKGAGDRNDPRPPAAMCSLELPKIPRPQASVHSDSTHPSLSGSAREYGTHELPPEPACATYQSSHLRLLLLMVLGSVVRGMSVLRREMCTCSSVLCTTCREPLKAFCRCCFCSAFPA